MRPANPSLNVVKMTRTWYWLFVMLWLVLLPTAAFAEGAAKEQSGAQVLQSFANTEVVEGDAVTIADKTKRQIMFLMGIPLLLLLIATTALGIAMGVYGKQVFVMHMLCAGLSLTLAVAHVVVGVVWFYPF
jgi:hypothetical protein